MAVSIHAPHARGDVVGVNVPVRESVSIHAPHARGDGGLVGVVTLLESFNPRPSCEGRLKLHDAVKDAYQFQSTPLMRGATQEGL